MNIEINEKQAYDTLVPAIYNKHEEELIANYMGEKATGGYHKSWDWLMPVILKINANGFFFYWENYHIKICRWFDGSGTISEGSFFKSEDAFKIIYKCVVEFLNKCYPVE